MKIMKGRSMGDDEMINKHINMNEKCDPKIFQFPKIQ
jgi:hypothetical protein